MFRKGSLSWFVWKIIEAVLLLTAGILCFINSGDSDFQYTIILTIGVLVIVDASLRLLTGVFNVVSLSNLTIATTDSGAAVAGSLELAAGISLCVISSDRSGEALFQFIGNFLGILMIVGGVVALCLSILYIAKKANDNKTNILMLIGSIVAIALGIIILVQINNAANSATSTVMQVFLVIVGITFCVWTLYVICEMVLIGMGKKVVHNVVKDITSDEDESK